MEAKRHVANAIKLNDSYFAVLCRNGTLTESQAKVMLNTNLEEKRRIYQLDYMECSSLDDAILEKEKMFLAYNKEYSDSLKGNDAAEILGKGIIMPLIILGGFSILQIVLNSLW